MLDRATWSSSMSLTSAVLAEKDCIFLVSIWEAYYTMSKPQACQRWLLCPFPPALSWRSDRGLCQKITSCPPSTFGLEYAIVTVSSESNGCIYHMAEILQCSIPRERSWVCGMSESSPTAMNQVGLCTQRVTAALRKVKACIRWVTWSGALQKPFLKGAGVQ